MIDAGRRIPGGEPNPRGIARIDWQKLTVRRLGIEPQRLERRECRRVRVPAASRSATRSVHAPSCGTATVSLPETASFDAATQPTVSYGAFDPGQNWYSTPVTG